MNGELRIKRAYAPTLRGSPSNDRGEMNRKRKAENGKLKTESRKLKAETEIINTILYGRTPVYAPPPPAFNPFQP